MYSQRKVNTQELCLNSAIMILSKRPERTSNTMGQIVPKVAIFLLVSSVCIAFVLGHEV